MDGGGGCREIVAAFRAGAYVWRYYSYARLRPLIFRLGMARKYSSMAPFFTFLTAKEPIIQGVCGGAFINLLSKFYLDLVRTTPAPGVNHDMDVTTGYIQYHPFIGA